jgi:hypothetical protein
MARNANTSTQIRPVHASPRGATLSLFVEVLQDDGSEIDGTESARAVAKEVSRPQNTPPGDDAPDALVFSVTWVPASGSQAAGWHLEATAADTAALSAGYYLADLRIDMGSGQIVQTIPLALDMRERVTEAA